MLLGEHVHLRLPAADLEKSWDFYRKMNFQKVEPERTVQTGITLSDGTAFYDLSEEAGMKPGLTYYADDLHGILYLLQDAGLEAEQELTPQGQLQRAFLTDPNGVSIALVAADTTKLPYNQGKPFTRCGKFYEISIETEKFEETVAFWQKLGFEINFQISPETRWLGLTDQLVNVGIYEKGQCPHIFKTPAITYFEPDMGKRIDVLKKQHFTFAQEIPNKEGVVNDAILETPEGLHLFLFLYQE